MRRYSRALLCALMILTALASAVGAYAATPSDWSIDHPELLETGHLFAESAILIDEDTGDVLFEKSPDSRMYPASTTKIMTLLLAIESGVPMDSIVTIPASAVDLPNDSSRIPVSSGEQLPFEDLLYGFMLRSGNDGAIAIAVTVSGSVDRFVDLMNQRASEIGCTSTHFVNPHGLHDDSHYTTARDLALITQTAMRNPIFSEIVGTSTYTMSETNMHSRREIESRVEMVNKESNYYYAACTGVKTGYTYKAGQCFVGTAKRGGRTIVAVILCSTRDYADRKWFDARCMFEYGLTRYDEYSLQQIYDMADSSLNSITVENAAEGDTENGNLALILSKTTNDSYTVMTLKETSEFTDDIDYFNNNTTITLAADYLSKIENRDPIEAGSIVGTLTYQPPEGEAITGTLIASRRVELAPVEVSSWDYVTDNVPYLKTLEDTHVIYIIIGVGVVIVLIIAVSIVRSVRRSRRRKRIYMQRKKAYYDRMRAQDAGRKPDSRKRDRRY